MPYIGSTKSPNAFVQAVGSIAWAIAWRTRMSSSGLRVMLRNNAQVAAGPSVVEDRVGLLLLQALEPARHRGALDHVHVTLDEGERARSGLGEEQHLEPVDLRLAAPVLVERPRDDLLLRFVADELERPAADGVEAQLVAQLLDRLAALHVAAEARHAWQKRR